MFMLVCLQIGVWRVVSIKQMLFSGSMLIYQFVDLVNRWYKPFPNGWCHIVLTTLILMFMLFIRAKVPKKLAPRFRSVRSAAVGFSAPLVPLGAWTWLGSCWKQFPLGSHGFITRWCPPNVINWFINPMNAIDISPTKTIVIGVINQLSYLGGTTLYDLVLYDIPWVWLYYIDIVSG